MVGKPSDRTHIFRADRVPSLQKELPISHCLECDTASSRVAVRSGEKKLVLCVKQAPAFYWLGNAVVFIHLIIQCFTCLKYTLCFYL